MIRVSEHRDLIEKMLTDYNLPKKSLNIVPSIQDWCSKNGHEEKNPFRIAKCICQANGTRYILIAEDITDDMISSSKSYMDNIGLSSEIASIDTDYKFLIHTVLHEIACPILETTDQFKRDKWAFAEMNKYTI